MRYVKLFKKKKRRSTSTETWIERIIALCKIINKKEKAININRDADREDNSATDVKLF